MTIAKAHPNDLIDELLANYKEPEDLISESMVDRYAKFATEHLAHAASRLDEVLQNNVIDLSQFWQSPNEKGLSFR